MNVIIIHSLVNWLMCCWSFHSSQSVDLCFKVCYCYIENLDASSDSASQWQLTVSRFALYLSFFFFFIDLVRYIFIFTDFALWLNTLNSLWTLSLVSLGILLRNFIDDRAGSEQYQMFWSYIKWNLTCGLRININRPSKWFNWLCLLEQFLIGSHYRLLNLHIVPTGSTEKHVGKQMQQGDMSKCLWVRYWTPSCQERWDPPSGIGR